ncbi:MAG: NAD-dependent epimerase/dehydratase family protein, partial [Telluria sp.]
MNTHLLALQLMAFQGCLGAFDTLYHHELTEALPGRATARLELSIHALRSLIYAALFIGLSAWQFHGIWAVLLLLVFTVEILLTLWDFVVEDRTRLLPATERVTHTVLAMNGGAFVMLLVLNAPEWFSQPTALAWQWHGALSVFLALCGVGVGLSGLRDGFAALALSRRGALEAATTLPGFGEAKRSFLVTGATGFIGQKLVRALLRDGQRVTVLTRQPRQAAWLFDGQVDCISSMDQLPASRRVDVIVNLAGARVLGWRWT